MQPERQLPSSSYNPQNICAVEGVITNALQSCSNYKELPCLQAGDFLTAVLRVVSHCGCKMNLAAASQVAFMQLISNTKNNKSKPLITTISLAGLQPG